MAEVFVFFLRMDGLPAVVKHFSDVRRKRFRKYT